MQTRVLPSTLAVLLRFACQYSSSAGNKNKRVDTSAGIGPMLDILARHMEPVIAGLPDAERKRFCGRLGRLGEAQVANIRASTDKLVCIALEHGISESHASKIRNGKLYRCR